MASYFHRVPDVILSMLTSGIRFWRILRRTSFSEFGKYDPIFKENNVIVRMISRIALILSRITP